MQKATKRAIDKYGRQKCLDAYRRHSVYGEGANTVGFLYGLTTRQADAAINAGRELVQIELGTTPADLAAAVIPDGLLDDAAADPFTAQGIVERVARLNPNAGEIGAGMLAQLVSDARRVLADQAEARTPRCACCGTKENLHEDRGSGGPYRCSSPDCMVY